MTWNPREILIGFLQRAMKQLLFLTVAFGFSTCGDQRSWPTVGCVSSDTFYGKLAKYQTYINRAFTQFHQVDRGIDMGETEGTTASKSGMSKHLKKKCWSYVLVGQAPHSLRTPRRIEQWIVGNLPSPIFGGLYPWVPWISYGISTVGLSPFGFLGLNFEASM